MSEGGTFEKQPKTTSFKRETVNGFETADIVEEGTEKTVLTNVQPFLHSRENYRLFRGWRVISISTNLMSSVDCHEAG